MRRHLFISLAALALLAGVAPILAGDDWEKDWKKLGSETASMISEKDTIKCGDEGKLKKLRLQVKDTGIQFDDIKVYLKNGKKLDWKTPDFLPAGGFDTFDLPGDGEKVEKVTFKYRKNLLKDDKARLILWGKK